VTATAFEIEGQHFVALNCGPQAAFWPVLPFVVGYATQQETDRLWDRLSEGGE
jgi:predicted 3-demethylubiquinone-9 3-methyltransferase (glyoxalase superfamily)